MIFPKTLKQKQRFKVLFFAFFIFFIGVVITLYSLKNFIVYYYTPYEILQQSNVVIGKAYRIGGIVKPSSIKAEGAVTKFVLSNSINGSEYEIEVVYTGALPSLFREGSGAIAEGIFKETELNNVNIFVANVILAKHDETYKPPESK